MDVSKQNKNTEQLPENMSAETIDGQELIETVVSLTGLPDSCLDGVHEELGQVIAETGHSSGTLTLDQLREAMLAYLEAVQAAYVESGGALEEPQAPVI